MTFQWQTENDNDWEQMPAHSAPKRPPQWVRMLPIFLLIIAVVGLGGITLYRQLNTRVVEATDRVKTDVLSSHNLILTAREQADMELFIALLSGRDSAWTKAQTDLFEAGLIVDRQMLGLSALSNPAIVQTVDLSPDLTEAVITLRQAYTATLKSGQVQTVHLQQTELFRSGDNRWLYAPPTAEFWGETIIEQGEFLTIQYPARDQAVVQQIMGPLENGLLALCQWVNGSSSEDEWCTGSFQLTLNFSPDPATFLTLTHPETRQTAVGVVNLPTPTLVGLPEDEAGVEALIRGYAKWVVSAGINSIVNYDGHAPLFYYALTDLILTDLGWQTSPPPPEQYANFLTNTETINLRNLVRNQSAVWSRPLAQSLAHPDRWQTYALLAFIHDQYPETSLFTLLSSLLHHDHFYQWSRAYLGEIVVQSNVEDLFIEGAWYRFLFNQTETSSAPPPIPFPEESLYFLCTQNTASILYQYDLAAQTETEILESGFVLPNMVRTPNQQGLILANVDITENPPRFRLVLWDGQAETLLGETTTGYLYPWGVDPLGRYAFFFQFTEDNRFPTPFLVELAQCGGEGCDWIPLIGLAFWSPNGSRTAIMDFQGGLWLGDEKGQNPQPVADNLPFFHFSLGWIDDDSYAYGRRNRENSEQIDLWEGSLEDGTERLLVPAIRYLEMLPAGLPAQAIQRVLVSPAHPDWVFFILDSASGNDPNSLSLFRIHRQTEELQLLLFERDLFVSLPSHLDFSPDGNWLSLLALDGGNANIPALYLYNLSTETLSAFPAAHEVVNQWVGSYIWSANSQWLIRSSQFSLHLIAPNHSYQKSFVHGIPSCQSLALLDK